jgi:hypothetical protein
VSVTTVAFVPAAPLLVPEVAGGSAAVDESLRAASLRAVSRAVVDRPDRVVVVGRVSAPGEWGRESRADFSGFGVSAVPAATGSSLPWQLSVGAWLLDAAGWDGDRRYVGVGDGVPAPGAAGQMDSRSSSVIVVGDGSACRSERAPGGLDPRAQDLDSTIADLLERGDVAGLGGVDPRLAEDLMCGSVPAWSWLVAALDGETVSAAELLVDDAPYGVGYFVALWSLA